MVKYIFIASIISCFLLLSSSAFPVFDNEMEIFGDDFGGFVDTAEVAPMRNFKIFKMFPARMETNKKRSLKPIAAQYAFSNHIEDYLPMPIKTLTPLTDHNY